MEPARFGVISERLSSERSREDAGSPPHYICGKPCIRTAKSASKTLNADETNGLATTGFELAHKRTRKREFLYEMNLVVPWTELVWLIEPARTERQNGRPPFVSTMLRIHFKQQWFGLTDPAMEESLDDVPLYREFAGLDAGVSRLPDESSILRFRPRLRTASTTRFRETD